MTRIPAATPIIIGISVAVGVHAIGLGAIGL